VRYQRVRDSGLRSIPAHVQAPCAWLPPLGRKEMRSASHLLSAQTDDPTQRPLDPADIAAYLNACIVESDGDPHVFAEALCYLADRHALRSMARACGVPADVLHRQLSGKRPLNFSTVIGAMRALGVELRVSSVHTGST